jgi:hypothetical protein
MYYHNKDPDELRNIDSPNSHLSQVQNEFPQVLDVTGEDAGRDMSHPLV